MCMDEGLDLARLALVVVFTSLLIGIVISLSSVYCTITDEGEVAEAVDSSYDKDVVNVPKDVPEVVTDNVVEVNNGFVNNFMYIDNKRVYFDYDALSVKAQELYENYSVQYYLVVISTKGMTWAEAQKEAQYTFKHLDCSDYACVQIVTDAGAFWFYGNNVTDFLTSTDKGTIQAQFANLVKVEPYVPNYIALYVLGGIVLAGVLCALYYWRTKVKHQKAMDDARILEAPLETWKNPLLSKYLEEN